LKGLLTKKVTRGGSPFLLGELLLHHGNSFFQFFDVDFESFIGFHQIIDGSAGVKNGCMVFSTAVKSDIGQRSFG
jgi:hypothetical protein